MYYIGVDIGGTGIQVGIVNEKGNIILKDECSTDIKGGFCKVLKDIEKLIRRLLDENSISYTDINSIGFGIPSFVNKKGEVTCVNLGWHNVKFVKQMKEYLPEFDIYVENDATVAALAENKFGSMKGRDVAVMLTLGTGVGGGIIINGQAFVGAHGMGSEVGHVIIGDNYFDCNCGNNGCFETFCSATAIIKYAQKLIKEGNETTIYDKCGKDINNINAKMIFDSYREGDRISKDIIQRFKNYLAIGIAGIINTIDPSVIAIGGGLSKSGDIILDGLEEEVRKHILYKEEEFADIVIATLGSEAGIIGAAFLN